MSGIYRSLSSDWLRSLRSAGHRSWQIRQPAAQSKLRELRQRARSACFVPVMQKMQNNRNFTLSHYFNRMTVWYEGMKKSQIDVCGGLVVHTKRTADLTLADDFIAYTDPTDNAARHNFEIYVAVVFPDGINETRLIRDPHHERQGIIGNAIGVKRGLKADATFTYWFGASWHKSGTADQAAWLSQIKRFVSNQRQPLQLSISKKE